MEEREEGERGVEGDFSVSSPDIRMGGGVFHKMRKQFERLR